jgi:hypothetical protein
VLPQAERIHQPQAVSSQERGRKSPNLFWGSPQNSGRAPFNQFIQGTPQNLGRAPNNQLSNIPSTLPPLHSLRLLPPPLCAQLTTYSLSSRQRPTHPSTPLVHSGLGCSLWPRYGHLETTQAVRRKSGSCMSLQQFLNSSGCGEKLIQISACFSVAR